jgi:deoxyribonuclease V
MNYRVLALDVAYSSSKAYSVGVVFSNFGVDEILWYTSEVELLQEYVPGEFYKRELPSLLKVIEQVQLSEIDFIIIDGYVFLDDFDKKGLGAHLFETIEEKVPIIGVAKSKFYNNTKNVLEVFRGKSTRPLYVTSIGMDIELAASFITNLSGEFRIPDILKKLDQKTKSKRNL